MARDWFDTGDHGIALGLEYGSLVDAATGGSVTPDTVSVKLSNAEAWIKTNNWPFTDSSNKLSWSGGLVADGSASNISAGTSSSKKLKELPKQSQPIYFGKTGSSSVALSLTGIEAAGETLSGSRPFTLPARPYHLPATPNVWMADGAIYCSGNQNNTEQDSYWSLTDWYLETNDEPKVAVVLNVPGTTIVQGVAMEANSRYRGYVYSENSTGTSPGGVSGYWYTAPNTPAAITATRANGSTVVNLSWDANGSLYVGSYRIYRSLNGGAYSHLKDVATTTTTDTVPLGSTASYYIVAYTPVGENQGVSANSATAAIGTGYNVPNPPGVAIVRTGVSTATVTITSNQNTATNDRYTAELDWQIQVNDAPFGGGAVNLAGTTTSFSLTALPADSRIQVQARFSNAAGESAWAQSGYLYTVPDAPSGFTAARADVASSTVNLSWVDNAAYETNALLEKKIGAGAWNQVATFPAGSVSGTVQQSQAESATYRLRMATPDNQYSGYSGEQTVGVAFVSNKNFARVGGGSLDLCFVGGTRIRRICKGAAVLWEDGDA